MRSKDRHRQIRQQVRQATLAYGTMAGAKMSPDPKPSDHMRDRPNELSSFRSSLYFAQFAQLGSLHKHSLHLPLISVSLSIEGSLGR